MKTVAVLLARGGSKGIPKKNIYPLGGKPLMAYGMEAAILSGLETWVSTDDEEIASVAEEWGVNVLKRPHHLSTDYASSESGLLHFAENVNFDRLVFIQPTSPLLRVNHLKGGLKMMEKYDSVFSGCKDHWVPKWRSKGEENFPYDWFVNSRPRRQDLATLFVENGAFYITSRERLMASKLRYSGRIGCYEMLPSESFQVDTLDDLRIIEALLER